MVGLMDNQTGELLVGMMADCLVVSKVVTMELRRVLSSVESLVGKLALIGAEL
jgi:hypothetical protein